MRELGWICCEVEAIWVGRQSGLGIRALLQVYGVSPLT